MNEWAASPHENRDKIGYLPAYTCNKRSTLRRRGCRHAAGSTHLDPVCSAADLSPYCLDAFHFAVDDLGPGDALDAFLIEVQPVLWACAGSAQGLRAERTGSVPYVFVVVKALFAQK